MTRRMYNHEFYKNRNEKTIYAATTVLSLLMDALPPIHSAVDFGCGVGTWLSAAKQMGVDDIQGLDGDWVDLELLEIPRGNFRHTDFENPVDVGKRFDLAITLEVAEHISEGNAGGFVDSLARASDFVLFSAAIPSQGGQGHVNEQWPEYWADLFEKKGYVTVDFIRKQIWNDRRIPTWYRQNMLLFAKAERAHDIMPALLDHNSSPRTPISFVHPELYALKVGRAQSLQGSWRNFQRALGRYIKYKLSWRG